jgi:hypothetical protein
MRATDVTALERASSFPITPMLKAGIVTLMISNLFRAQAYIAR